MSKEKVLTANNIILPSSKVAVVKDITAWAKSMGFHFKSTPKVLETMPANQVPVWLYIMKHVKPSREARLIKRNMLIHKLNDLMETEGSIESYCNSEEEKTYKKLRKEINEKELEMNKLQNDLRLKMEAVKTKQAAKETLCEELNDIEKKIELLEIKKTMAEEGTKEMENNSLLLKVCLSRFDAKNKLSEEESKIKIKESLSELEKYYCIHDTADGKADLSVDEAALQNKIYSNCFDIPANTLFTYLLNDMKHLNSEMSNFLQTSMTLRKKDNCNKVHMDVIRTKHVNVFIENYKTFKAINELKTKVEAKRDELCKKLCEHFSDYGIQSYSYSLDLSENESMESLVLDFLNDKIFNEYTTKHRRNYLIQKCTDLNEETASLEAHIATMEQQNRQLDSLNMELKNKYEIVSKSVEFILQKKYMTNYDLSKKIENDVIANINSMRSKVNNPFVDMQGRLRDEVELFVQVPLKKFSFPRRQLPSFSLIDNSYWLPSSPCLDLLPIDVFVSKIWSRLLSSLVRDQPEVPASTFGIINDQVKAYETKERELKFNEHIKAIETKLASANDTFLDGESYSFLLQDDINKMLYKEKISDDLTFEEVINIMREQENKKL